MHSVYIQNENNKLSENPGCESALHPTVVDLINDFPHVILTVTSYSSAYKSYSGFPARLSQNMRAMTTVSRILARIPIFVRIPIFIRIPVLIRIPESVIILIRFYVQKTNPNNCPQILWPGIKAIKFQIQMMKDKWIKPV